MSKDILVSFKIASLKAQVVDYMEEKCGFPLQLRSSYVDNPSVVKSKEMRESERKMRRQAQKIWNQYFVNKEIWVQIHEFGTESITKDGFCFGDCDISCKAMQLAGRNEITGGWIYLFSGPQWEEEESDLLDNYFMQAWQVAVMDAVRVSLREFLQRKIQRENVEEKVSSSFGPGFYGMSVECIPVLYKELLPIQVNVKQLENGLLYPKDSLLGMFLRSKGEISIPQGDCASCMAVDARCEWCQYHKNKL